MTNNNNISKSTQGNDDENSNQQGRRRQRRRINLNQEDEPDRSRRVPMGIELSLRSANGGVYPNTGTSNNQILGGTTIPYRPMDISSILRLSSSMRRGNSTIGTTNSNFARTTISIMTTTPPLNREAFIHILDCAVAICDECLDDPNTVDDDVDDHW